MENIEKGERFSGWDAFDKIQVIKGAKEQKVLLRGRPYMAWSNNDQVSQRLAIVQLYDMGAATQEELSEAFDIHVKTVYNYIAAFEKDGASGLLSQQRGPRDPWKITPETRFKILEVTFGSKNISYENIAKLIKERWNKEISRRTICRVLAENGFISQPMKEENQEQEENLFEKTGDKEQPLFDLKENSNKDASSEKDLRCDGLQGEEGNDQKEEIAANETIISEGFKYRKSFYSSTERTYLNRLERGEYSAYAGGLLFTPLLEWHNYLPTIRRVIDVETCEGYTLEQLCLTLLYCDIFGFRSIENFKTVYPEEFGILIGKTCSPSIFTMRRFLHKVKALKKGEQLMKEFGKEYLTAGLVKSGILYIDSHFLPYYGICVITMGWHGVRQKPMKGSYNFLAIDDKFNPLIFFIRPSSEDLIKKIPEIVLKAKEMAKESGIADDKIVVVFDREGYCAELFREFDSDKIKATFITWAKYFDSWKPKIKEEQFDKSVMIKYEIQKSEEVKYFEAEERTMNKYGKIRAIVIQSGRKKKQSAIYTNNWELSAEYVIQLICRRWGQETLIKTLRLDHRIDYFPGYESEELEKQPMVDNPMVEKLKQEKANLLKDLHKLKSGFVDILLDKVCDGTNWDEIKEKRIKTLADIQTIRTRILLIDNEIGKLPKEIRFDEAHGVKLVEFDYEKKRFLDCIKIFSYTMQKKACGILSKYYYNPKDIWQVLGMIAQRGADLKLNRNVLTVKLKRFKDEVVDYAARCLCEELNEMAPTTLDKYRFKLRYEVE